MCECLLVSSVPAGTAKPGVLPLALVAQRIEQKTVRLQATSPHRTTYRVVGEKLWVVRLACDCMSGSHGVPKISIYAIGKWLCRISTVRNLLFGVRRSP